MHDELAQKCGTCIQEDGNKDLSTTTTRRHTTGLRYDCDNLAYIMIDFNNTTLYIGYHFLKTDLKLN